MCFTVYKVWVTSETRKLKTFDIWDHLHVSEEQKCCISNIPHLVTWSNGSNRFQTYLQSVREYSWYCSISVFRNDNNTYCVEGRHNWIHKSYWIVSGCWLLTECSGVIDTAAMQSRWTIWTDILVPFANKGKQNSRMSYNQALQILSKAGLVVLLKYLKWKRLIDKLMTDSL